MKPAKFHYASPGSIDEALTLLGSEEDARVLAGGQSLVPIMNFRLARPSMLVDINRIGDLAFTRTDNATLRIGALARHSVFEKPVADGPIGALLPRVTRHIAHVPIRIRGTFAGSLAHADPASEWCTLALTAGADIVARKSAGERTIAAEEFFEGVFTTALAPDEMISEIALPLYDQTWKAGFAEYARRAGDYAIVMAVALIRIDQGRIAEARIGLGNVIDRPIRSDAAESTLLGQAPEPDVFTAAGTAAAAAVEPHEDVHSDAAYKRDLVRAMVARALADALAS
jgi:carbon-monoxide dehydrogenase medium subunit